MNLRFGPRFWLMALFLFISPLAGHTQNDVDGDVKTSLIVSHVDVIPGQTFHMGLLFQMRGDWHTYYKNPGDTGLPVQLTWQMPEGFSAGDVVWPTPEKIVLGQLVNYGYKNETLLRVPITAPANLQPGKVYSFLLDATFLVCEEICLPVNKTYSVQVAAAEKPTENRWATPLFAKYSPTYFTLKPQQNLQVYADNSTYYIAMDAGLPRPALFVPDAENVIVDIAPQHYFKSPQTGELGNLQVLAIAKETYDPLTLNTLQGLVFWEDPTLPPLKLSADIAPLPATFLPHNAAETVPAANAKPALFGVAVPSLLAALLAAFAAGVVLNLMPCVLPVLSLKVLSLVTLAQHNKRLLRAHAGVFFVGVLVSFWVLAAVLMMLKQAGEAVGWGFQLQSAPFVAVLAALLLLVSLNLFGVFDVGHLFAKLQHSTAHQNPQTNTRKGLVESFFAGVLATVVATPCTAPFMATAVGFALSQPTGVMLLVFSFMALGLAAPYVLVCFAPAVLSRFPKPGAWMFVLRQALAFPVLATVLWLVWVFGKQHNETQAFLLLILLLGLAFVGWVYGHLAQLRRPTSHRLLGVVLLLLSLASYVYVVLHMPEKENGLPSSVSPAAATNQLWQPWSPQAVDAARAEQRAVFINYTADWCITCKLNELSTLNNPAVTNLFQLHNVALFKADWTNYNADITLALESFGRKGVPLYVYYAPTKEQPVILPQLLTPAMLKKLLAPQNIRP